MSNCNIIGTPMDVNTKYSKAMDGDDEKITYHPKTPHWSAAKRIMRYIKGTIEYKIAYGGKANITGFCDSDYAADIDDRNLSTSGFIFMMNGGAISWSTKKQPVDAQSTAEAEYTSLSMATKEAIWLRSMNFEISGTIDTIQ